MSSIALLLVGLSAFYTGYAVYSKYISKRIYQLDPDFRTPAHELEDGVDYIPTNRHVLFGHHFTSVAGAAPIVGPAIAVIWGWLPAFLWVVLGTIFAGAVHDFGTLWVSTRHKGRSIGTLAESFVGGRARVLFLLIIFFLLLLVNAVFAVVIANLFIGNPGAVVPVWGSLVVALVVGFVIYRTRAGILIPSTTAPKSPILQRTPSPAVSRGSNSRLPRAPRPACLGLCPQPRPDPAGRRPRRRQSSPPPSRSPTRSHLASLTAC